MQAQGKLIPICEVTRKEKMIGLITTAQLPRVGQVFKIKPKKTSFFVFYDEILGFSTKKTRFLG
jgi:hypothetical protein